MACRRGHTGGAQTAGRPDKHGARPNSFNTLDHGLASPAFNTRGMCKRKRIMGQAVDLGDGGRQTYASSYASSSSSTMAGAGMRKLMEEAASQDLPDDTNLSEVTEEDRKERMRVVVRVRPPMTQIFPPDVDEVPDSSSRESTNEDGGEEVCVRIEGDNVLRLDAPRSSAAWGNNDRESQSVSYELTQVLGPSTSQMEVFKSTVEPLVQRLFDNSESGVLLSYGVTNAGKSYTVFGSQDGTQPGLIPHTLRAVFQLLDKKKEESEVNGNLGVKISMCELSMENKNHEKVKDLLSPSCALIPFKVHESKRTGHMSIEGIQQERVDSVKEAMETLKKGYANRKVEETGANKSSSRGHCVVSIQLCAEKSPSEHQQPAVDGKGRGLKGVMPLASQASVRGATLALDDLQESFARICFVDLAGSERQRRTKNEGERLKESGAINSSLMSLRQCLEELSKNQRVNFRRSKLTQFLKNELQGQGRLVVVVNISPEPRDFDETIQVMKYASMACGVRSCIPEPLVNIFKLPLPKEQLPMPCLGFPTKETSSLRIPKLTEKAAAQAERGARARKALEKKVEARKVVKKGCHTANGNVKCANVEGGEKQSTDEEDLPQGKRRRSLLIEAVDANSITEVALAQEQGLRVGGESEIHEEIDASSCTQEVRLLEEKVAKQERLLTLEQEEHNQTRSHVTELESRLVVMEEERDRARSRVTELESRLVVMEEERDRARSRVSELEAETAVLHKRGGCSTAGESVSAIDDFSETLDTAVISMLESVKDCDVQVEGLRQVSEVVQRSDFFSEMPLECPQEPSTEPSPEWSAEKARFDDERRGAAIEGTESSHDAQAVDVHRQLKCGESIHCQIGYLKGESCLSAPVVALPGCIGGPEPVMSSASRGHTEGLLEAIMELYAARTKEMDGGVMVDAQSPDCKVVDVGPMENDSEGTPQNLALLMHEVKNASPLASVASVEGVESGLQKEQSPEHTTELPSSPCAAEVREIVPNGLSLSEESAERKAGSDQHGADVRPTEMDSEGTPENAIEWIHHVKNASPPASEVAVEAVESGVPKEQSPEHTTKPPSSSPPASEVAVEAVESGVQKEQSPEHTMEPPSSPCASAVREIFTNGLNFSEELAERKPGSDQPSADVRPTEKDSEGTPENAVELIHQVKSASPPVSEVAVEAVESGVQKERSPEHTTELPSSPCASAMRECVTNGLSFSEELAERKPGSDQPSADVSPMEKDSGGTPENAVEFIHQLNNAILPALEVAVEAVESGVQKEQSPEHTMEPPSSPCGSPLREIVTNGLSFSEGLAERQPGSDQPSADVRPIEKHCESTPENAVELIHQVKNASPPASEMAVEAVESGVQKEQRPECTTEPPSSSPAASEVAVEAVESGVQKERSPKHTMEPPSSPCVSAVREIVPNGLSFSEELAERQPGSDQPSADVRAMENDSEGTLENPVELIHPEHVTASLKTPKRSACARKEIRRGRAVASFLIGGTSTQGESPHREKGSLDTPGSAGRKKVLPRSTIKIQSPTKAALRRKSGSTPITGKRGSRLAATGACREHEDMLDAANCLICQEADVAGVVKHKIQHWERRSGADQVKRALSKTKEKENMPPHHRSCRRLQPAVMIDCQDETAEGDETPAKPTGNRGPASGSDPQEGLSAILASLKTKAAPH
ncbi:hypothetical protein CBR_g51942 [Chara braunii]|uniref:Kinesin motor domain-containing protein n=1 Tax=Chara braunii TaxID=69332 RepID=A0A388K6G6_CHABU|nr:hypothetical protein CBR_g51942 [Chara braunii]|eukprot:GBG65642.1 hypothetical protein CBR_g51942 [Chara braunii]